MDNLDPLLSVLLALGLGGAIGIERELAGKPAGLRTNMLVAGAAAFFVHLSDLLVERAASDAIRMTGVRADATRVIEAVVTGVSFIGAGTILRRTSELEVEGLTTAATLLFTASVGMAAALDAPWLGVSVTLAVLVTLRLVGLVEDRLTKRLRRIAEAVSKDPPA
jgi:putative Mg2+ transporter-C (MgtC) family protein